MDIHVNVIGQKLRLVRNYKNFIDGSNRFIKFIFDLDSGWDGLMSYAQFTQDGNSYNVYLDEENSVFMPPEIKVGKCTMTLSGTGDGVIATTDFVTLTILKNILTSGEESTEITESLYEQLIDKINATSKDIDEIEAEMEDYVSEIQGKIDAEAAARARNDNMLNSRIDTFMTLPEGTTTRDAEIIDARIGYDGTMYATVGSAIRTQVSDTNNRVDENSGDIQEVSSLVDELSSALTYKVDGAYVEEGVAYFTCGDEVLFSITGIGGGGGGGGSSGNNAVLTVNNTTGWLAKTISYGQRVAISLNWSSLEDEMPTGDGTLQVIANGSSVRTMNISQGDVTVDITNYINVGSNAIRIRVTDIYGNMRNISFNIKAAMLTITSNFDASVIFSANNPIDYTYTPNGAMDKTVHFIVDGREIGTAVVTTSGRQQTQRLGILSHGDHILEAYFTAEVDGEEVVSNTLHYSLSVVDPESNTPIISSQFNTTSAAQYTVLSIPYRVYTPNSLTSDIKLIANNVEVSSITVDRTEHSWAYRADEAGTLTLKIQSGVTTKTITITIEEADIDIQPEENNLMLYLSSYGRSNAEANPGVWRDEDRNISASMTGFNFVSDGWIKDSDGNTALRVVGDARVTIPYKPFASDFRGTGKTIEVEFATRDILDYDAVIMSCMSGNVGFQITTQRATLKSEQSIISTQFKEDEHVTISFIVEKRSENRLIFIAINGIISGVIQYPNDDDFSQRNPVNITIGADGCATDIYHIRVYDNDLTRYQMLNNWIADTLDGALMKERYDHNNIYDEYGQVVISKLPKDLPYFILNAPELPQYKGDKKVITGSYVDPQFNSRSFTFEGCQINVQGTSSAPYARKNYDMQFKKGFEMANGGHADNYALAPSVIPFNRFVLKADVASSEGANNVELVKLYNDATPFKRREQEDNPLVRQGIYGFPIAVFWHNTDTNETTFLGKYNFNLPKRAPGPYGYSGNMESWEFQNNTSDLMLFLTDYFDETMYTDPTTGDSKELWKYDYEARFPEDTWSDYSKLQELQSFVYSTYRANATGNALPAPVTYEKVTYTNDTADYRLAKFRAEFGKYAEVSSFIFYYIFTELFLMVDSRAKNLFIGFSGSDTTGLTAIDRKAVAEPYDMDTAIGTNNEGSLVFGYSLEDTDHLEGADVFNGQNSVLWCNIRDAFPAEIVTMYQNLRSTGILSYPVVEQRFEDHQSKWPEALFNEDSHFKYIAPLIDPDPGKEPTDVYLPMLQGSKAEQRKWWLYNRFRYMDSKWNAGDALSEVIQLRGYAKSNITVTPYADIYPTVKYGSYLVAERGQHGVPTELVCPLDNVNDTEIYIYSAPQLAFVGDLSGLKVGFADFSKATKLQAIVVGSNAAGYTNPNLTGLSAPASTLLGLVDARNCTALTGTVDLSQASNIETVYLDGTAVTAVSLPVGGILKTLHLPGTVTNLTVRNQPGITEFVMPTYNNITTLRVENCGSGIPILDILDNIEAGSRVRIIGFTLTVSSTDDVEDFYDYLDTMRGLDEYGGNLDKAVVSGTITGLNSVTGAWLAEMQARYPDVRITYNHITSELKYYNYDGSELLHTETINDGGNGTYSGTPTRAATAEKIYTFTGWNKATNQTTGDPNATKAVTADRSVYAAYSETIQTYTVVWKNGSTTLRTDTNVAYGTTPVWGQAMPTSDGQTATGWTPNVGPITGNTTYSAVYLPMYNVNFYNGTTLLQTVKVVQGGNAVYTGATPTKTGVDDPEKYEFLKWNPEPTNVQAAMDVYAVFKYNGYLSYKLIDRTLEGEYENGRVENVGISAFSNCTKLTSVKLPAATSIGNSAFSSCGKLTSIEIPAAISIGYYAFYNCTNLASVKLPAATSIGISAFSNCTKLTSVKLPAATSIGNSAFSSCGKLTSIELPAAISIGNYAFNNCSKLTDIYLSVKEGEISGAPWGAINATIHYEYDFGGN